MTASPERRARWSATSRRRRDKELFAARQGRTTCPKRIGRGTCGGLLEDRVLPGGRVVTTCRHCERKAQGLCRHCPARVTGRGVYCAPCRHLVHLRSSHRYRTRHREEVRRSARLKAVVYRATHREEIRERRRRGGKYFAAAPTCRRCGDAVPYPGRGRPRLDCTTCRPGRAS